MEKKGVATAMIMGDGWYYAKQAMIFFLIESVLLGIPQLYAEGVCHLHERLEGFVWA